MRVVLCTLHDRQEYKLGRPFYALVSVLSVRDALWLYNMPGMACRHAQRVVQLGAAARVPARCAWRCSMLPSRLTLSLTGWLGTMKVCIHGAQGGAACSGMSSEMQRVHYAVLLVTPQQDLSRACTSYISGAKQLLTEPEPCVQSAG